MPFASEAKARLAVIAVASAITPDPLLITKVLFVPLANFVLAIAAAAATFALSIANAAIVGFGYVPAKSPPAAPVGADPPELPTV